MKKIIVLSFFVLLINFHFISTMSENKTSLKELPQKICREASLTARCIAFCATRLVNDKKNAKKFFKRETFKKLPKDLVDKITVLKHSLSGFNSTNWLTDSIGIPLVKDPLLVEAFISTNVKVLKTKFLKLFIEFACVVNSIYSLDYFFKKHAIDINIDLDNNTPLFWATYAHKSDAVRWLLDHGAQNKICGLGFPLHRAVNNSVNPFDFATKLDATEAQIKTIQCLLDYKVDINCLDQWHNTPLDNAITENNEVVIKLLREHGALTYEELKAHIKKRNKDKEPELLAYAAVGNNEGISLLLKDGVDINCTDKEGNTPLMLAARNDYKEVVEQLVKLNADKSLKNRYNQTAYDLATETGNQKIAQLLKLQRSLSFPHMVAPFMWGAVEHAWQEHEI